MQKLVTPIVFLPLMVAAFVGVLIWIQPGPSPREPREVSSSGTLEMRLFSGTTLMKRQQWPRISVDFLNASPRPADLVLPGHGSEVGLRTPVVAWSVRRISDRTPHAFRPLSNGAYRCGNIPPLLAKELVTLKAGEKVSARVDVSGLAFGAPGTYRVVLFYAHDPAADWDTWRMLAPVGDELWGQMKATPAQRLRSNELVFHVVE